MDNQVTKGNIGTKYCDRRCLSLISFKIYLGRVSTGYMHDKTKESCYFMSIPCYNGVQDSGVKPPCTQHLIADGATECSVSDSDRF
jgi:hypothetical protein